jgi:hypothetical protein
MTPHALATLTLMIASMLLNATNEYWKTTAFLKIAHTFTGTEKTTGKGRCNDTKPAMA